MLSKNKNIFVKRNCLSKEELISYAKQNISEMEKHHIEKHLLDCELCTDALEGIRLLSDPADLKSISSDMLRKLREENPVSKKNNTRSAFLVAAAIACVLIISGIYFTYLHNFENSNPELAVLPLESKKDNVAAQPLLLKDNDRMSLKESTNNSSMMETKTKSPDKINSQTKNELQQVITTEPVAGMNNKEVAADVPKTSDEMIEVTAASNEKSQEEISLKAEQAPAPVQDNINAEENVKRANDNAKAITYSDRAISQKSQTVTMSEVASKKNKSDLAKTNIDESLKVVQMEIENENYKSALVKLDELSKEYPENMNVKYLNGVVYYKTNEGKKALDCFNAVLNSGDKNLFEDSRLHKALTYIKLSDNKNARIILNQIIGDKSRYKERAWELLEQIDGN